MSLLLSILFSLLLVALHTQYIAYVFLHRTIGMPFPIEGTTVFAIILATAFQAAHFGATFNGVNNFNDDRKMNGVGQALLILVLQVSDAFISYYSVVTIAGLRYMERTLNSGGMLPVDFNPARYDISFSEMLPVLCVVGAVTLYTRSSQWALVLSEVTGSIKTRAPKGIKRTGGGPGLL